MRQPSLYYNSYNNVPSVRGLPSRRANRIRFSWFVLGTVAGITLSYLAQSLLGKSTATEDYHASALKVLESTISSTITPETSGENAVEAYVAALQPQQKLSTADDGTTDLKVRSGDTLISLLVDKGVALEEAHDVVDALKKKYNPKNLNVGTNLALELENSKASEETAKVKSLSIPISNISTLELTRERDGGFNVDRVDEKITMRKARAGGVISSSLYQTGVDAGIPSPLIGEIINAYSYDIDFQRDIQQGDKLNVVFEKKVSSDGDSAGYGKMLYAELKSGGRTLRIYRFTDRNGNSNYYNEKGESVKKALLKTPINGARITSGFGMRHHPIMGYSKMHKGVDFGAASGTPVYAAGDGVVKFAGRKGAYGNYIQIGHTDKYATAYAHLSRYASGITSGKRVKQGQIVGYVGSTGRSTGPHLHYEVLVKGAQVNPNSIKFPFGNSLRGTELANFRKMKKAADVELATLPKEGEQVAALSSADVSN